MTRLTVDADVVVMGAGLAGLTAARALRRAGVRVVVVEARDRLGGRLAPFVFADGTRADLGGQWHGPGHDGLRGLAAELGLASHRTATKGLAVFETAGRAGRYRGELPFVNPLVLAGLGLAVARIGRLAREAARVAPGSARAAELDAESVHAWLEREVRPEGARELLRFFLEALSCSPLEDVSLYFALLGIARSASLTTLLGIEGGSQEQVFTGGTAALVGALAQDLGPWVRLGAPVHHVKRRATDAVVYARGLELRARRVISTLPPAQLLDVEVEAPLEPERRALLASMPMGNVVKCLLRYERPFWREHNLSGYAWSTRGPVASVFDASPPGGTAGVLVAFVEAAHGARVQRLAPEVRRREVVRAVAGLFGAPCAEALRSPSEYVDLVWADEPWTGGGYSAHARPGSFASGGALLARPCGVLHFAGTEVSARWPGYMEGAVHSGEHVAREVAASLALRTDDRSWSSP